MRNKSEELIRIEKINFEKDSATVVAESKQIQKERKNENILKKKEKQNRDNLEKRKNEENKKKKVFESYKPLMKRSKPKTIKKRVENDNKLSKDDLDKLYFLGFY